jgi:hypothetical protein
MLRSASVSHLAHPLAATSTPTSADTDNVQAGPDGENVQGGPNDGSPEASGTGETPETTADTDTVQDATTPDTTSGSVTPAVKRTSVFSNTRVRAPLNIVGTYNGTQVTRKPAASTPFILHVTSEDAQGVIGGTLTIGSGTSAVTTPFTGTIHGRSIKITATVNGDAVTIRGSATRDSSSIHGTSILKHGTTRTRSRIDISRTA